MNLTWTESNRGLGNLGNTCYMNSALQCLHKTFELSNTINTAKRTPFVKAYIELMEELSKDSKTAFRPTEIKALIGKYNPLFSDYTPHDSAELMETVLNHLNEDLNEVVIKKKYDIDPNIERTDE